MATTKNVLTVCSILLSQFLTSDVGACSKNERYIYYDAVAAGDNRAIVIDHATDLVVIRNKPNTVMSEAADLDGVSEDSFGGSNEDCGNNLFFCVMGALEIVIPKNVSLTSWRYHGLFCKSHKAQKTGVYEVTCRESVRGNVFLFAYSVQHGILSFQNSPLGGRGLFKLRGDDGLFSQCSQSAH